MKENRWCGILSALAIGSAVVGGGTLCFGQARGPGVVRGPMNAGTVNSPIGQAPLSGQVLPSPGNANSPIPAPGTANGITPSGSGSAIIPQGTTQTLPPQGTTTPVIPQGTQPAITPQDVSPAITPQNMAPNFAPQSFSPDEEQPQDGPVNQNSQGERPMIGIRQGQHLFMPVPPNQGVPPGQR